MDKDTQLPADWVDKLNREALEKYPVQLHRVQNGLPTDLREYERQLWLSGATEYAIKLQQLQQDYDFLKLKYDNILATESGHESKTENVWQSGYAAGHEAASSKNQNNMNVYDIINKGENGDL